MKKHWKQLAKEVIEKGCDILNWACDSGINGELQSNGSIEHLYCYEKNYYLIRTPFNSERALSCSKLNREKEIYEYNSFIGKAIEEFEK